MNSKKKLARVVMFVSQNDLNLQHACLLLGGTPALGRLQRFRRRLALAEKLTSDIRRDLVWMQDLFQLEHVHKFESDEAHCFEALALEDPMIFVVCTLTEALETLLGELNQCVSVSNDTVSAAA